MEQKLSIGIVKQQNKGTQMPRINWENVIIPEMAFNRVIQRLPIGTVKQQNKGTYLPNAIWDYVMIREEALNGIFPKE